MWVRKYLEDIRSDFSVFHNVDEIEELEASKFFPRARRLLAYKGALRFTAEQENENRKTVKGVDGKTRQVDETYTDPSQNTEALAAGIFEAGTG